MQRDEAKAEVLAFMIMLDLAAYMKHILKITKTTRGFLKCITIRKNNKNKKYDANSFQSIPPPPPCIFASVLSKAMSFHYNKPPLANNQRGLGNNEEITADMWTQFGEIIH